MIDKKAVVRNGARFDCERCGTLLRDDDFHRTIHKQPCSKCGGELRMVAYSVSRMTGDAKWFKCERCGEYYMHRRGELVDTKPRSGFDQFA